jgi:hypothetical protein
MKEKCRGKNRLEFISAVFCAKKNTQLLTNFTPYLLFEENLAIVIMLGDRGSGKEHRRN